LYKTLFYWTAYVKYYIFMTLNLRSFKKSKKYNDSEKFTKLFTKSCKLFSEIFYKSAKIDFDIIGQDKINLNETYLVVSNHLGIADIATVIKSFPKPICFVSKIELSRVPIFSEWLRTAGSIFIDRNNNRSSIIELNRGIEVLKSGTSMCVFPEGKRNNTGRIEEFKKGSFKLAFKSGVKILPMVLYGTREIYEDNNNMIRDGNVKVRILDPIDIHSLDSDELRNLHVIVRDRMNEVYKQLK